MQQLSFFGHSKQKETLLPGLIDYIPGLFNQGESDTLLQKFISETPWMQRAVHMYGKEVLTPRLTAWFGDSNTDHSFSGGGSAALPWTSELLLIREKVKEVSGIKFNSVLLNYYRNGNDSVSWHDDRDGVAGRNRFVASVSLGAMRIFDIRNKDNHGIKHSIPLKSGSYLLMKGNFQEEWQHRIARAANIVKPRVNLTFRISKHTP